MAYSGNTGLTRIIKAGGYSWKGLKATFKHEAAFRQELALFVILAPIAIWLGHTGLDRAMLIGSLFLILIVELLNSAVEAAIDRFGHEIHKLSARAKDMGSAAVLLSILNAVVIWGLILIPWPSSL
ncbi:MAG: diacylglycerol kinase [Gammaproteobacteria bacterium]|jgi:diacylglycerol kinase (ATP)